MTEKKEDTLYANRNRYLLHKKNFSHGTVIDYSLQDFRTASIERFKLQSCILCGEIHPLQIHSYPKRCWRNPVSLKNERIRIITIICEKSKEAGNQYTKRLLPDFLLPGKVIRADLTLKSVEEARDPLNAERASSILGCIDLRTARKYLRYGYLAIKKACVSLAEKLSRFPGNPYDRQFTPNTHLLSSFRVLVKRFSQLQLYLHGSRGYVLQHRDFAFLGLHWKGNKPTTCVSDPVSAPDTT